ncbi:MAG: rRNA maturation RNase YbeY [Bryobacteraceae bacterium]
MPTECTARDALIGRRKQSRPAALCAVFTREQTTLLFHSPTPGLARRLARTFAKRLESEVTLGRPFTCLIAGDPQLRRLNRDFRQKDYATDVLSFPSRQNLGFLGDIAISFQHAERQAAEYGHGVGQEIEILMLHGVLHLLGMDHEKDRGQMARAENKWRARFGLPRGLIRRVSE